MEEELSQNIDSLSEPVPMFDPVGKPFTVERRYVPHKLSMGYRIATPEEVGHQKALQDYGSGLFNSGLAAVAGAARGPTLGISDWLLTHSDLVRPEVLEALKEQHPIPSLVGEVLGIGGAIGAAARKGVVGALGRATPAYTVHRLGRSAMNRVAPIASLGAEKIASSATSPMAHEILKNVGTLGVGSAVEGAFYGLGGLLSENALGNADFNGENILGSVGLGSILGFGLGSAIGLPAGWLKSRRLGLPWKPQKEIGAMGAVPYDVESNQQLRMNFDAAKDLEEIQKMGIETPNPGAKIILEASKELGLPVFEEQLTHDNSVRERAGRLLVSPSEIGQERLSRLYQGIGRVGDIVEEILGKPMVGSTGEAMTKAQLGEELEQKILERLDHMQEPFNKFYDLIRSAVKSVPLDQNTSRINLQQRARNLVKIGKAHLDVHSPAYTWLRQTAEGLEKITNLEDLQYFKTSRINAAKTQFNQIDPRMAFEVNEFRKRMDDLMEQALLGFASKNPGIVPVKAVEEYLTRKRITDLQYKAFAELRTELGKKLGKSKIHGTGDLKRWVEHLSAEKIVDRLLSKEDQAFLKFLKQNLPDEFGLLTDWLRTGLRVDDNFRLNGPASLRKINKLSPDLIKQIFNPDQIDKLSKLNAWVESLAKHPNPSGSGILLDWQKSAVEFLKNPASWGLRNATDLYNLKEIRKKSRIPGMSDEEAGFLVKGLSFIERGTQKTAKTLDHMVNGIFDLDYPPGTFSGKMSGLVSESLSEQKKEIEDLQRVLDQLTGNPEAMIDHLDHAGSALYPMAPQTMQALSKATANAIVFLSGKIPRPTYTRMGVKLDPSRSDLMKFNNYLGIVKNPFLSLSQVKAGTIGQETMEVMKQVYPAMLAEMRGKVMERLIDFRAEEKQLPYKRQLALSTFMEEPLTESLNPQTILQTQSVLQSLGMQKQAQALAQNAPKNRHSSLSKLNLANRMKTNAQASAQREIT